MDVARDPLPHNTPDARAAAVNAPLRYEGMTLSTYPGKLPNRAVDLVDSPRSCVIFGQNGVGKTAIGLEVLRNAARMGVGSTEVWNSVTDPAVVAHNTARRRDQRFCSPVWFEAWSPLLERRRRELRGALAEESVEWLDELDHRVSFLMLDDVGVESGTEFRESFLLRHLEWAADPGHALVMTVNGEPEEWVALGARCFDRMRALEMLHVPGTSLR